MDHLPVLEPAGLVALPVVVRRFEDPDRGLLAEAVNLVGVENALPFLRIRGQDAGADQDRVGLRGDHEVRAVILRNLRALQHDQELAALAAIRADHAGIRDRPLPEVDDPATGRPGRHLVHQQTAGVAQLREGDDVGRRVVRGDDRQLLFGGPVDDQVARLAAERAEVRVAPLHHADGRARSGCRPARRAGSRSPRVRARRSGQSDSRWLRTRGTPERVSWRPCSCALAVGIHAARAQTHAMWT